MIDITNDWNELYFQKKGILPPDILVRMSVHNKGADKLISTVSSASKK